MAENALNTRPDANLLAFGQQASSAIVAAGDPGYGLDIAQTAALTAANSALAAGITNTAAARAASKAATQEKLTARNDLLAALSSIGASIYNNPAVTDQMLADAGFAIHDTVPTKHFPFQPTGLLASPDASGTVLLEWDLNGNVYGVTYVIEGRAVETDPWGLVATTTRRRISVPGFTPGQTHWFRVTASHNEQNSIPSSPVAIWGPEGVTELQVAA